MKSEDAGATWLTVQVVDFVLQKITFNNNFGFCTAINGNIISNDDDGQTWALTTTLDAYNATDIKFNSGNGFCLANNLTVYKTTNDGGNWVPTFTSEFSSYVLNPLTESSCLVFGEGDYTGGDFRIWYGAIRQSKNSGNDWTEIQFKNIQAIRCTSFYSTTEGYAVAANDLIKVTVK